MLINKPSFSSMVSFFKKLYVDSMLCISTADTKFARLMYAIVNLFVGINIMVSSSTVNDVLRRIISEPMYVSSWTFGLLFAVAGVSGIISTTRSMYNRCSVGLDGVLPTALWFLLTYYTQVFSTQNYGMSPPHVMWMLIPFMLYMRYPRYTDKGNDNG